MVDARVSVFIFFVSAIGSMKTIDFKFKMSRICVLQTLFSSNNRLKCISVISVTLFFLFFTGRSLISQLNTSLTKSPCCCNMTKHKKMKTNQKKDLISSSSSIKPHFILHSWQLNYNPEQQRNCLTSLQLSRTHIDCVIFSVHSVHASTHTITQRAVL